MAIHLSEKQASRLLERRSARVTGKASPGARGRATGQRGPLTGRSKFNAQRTTVDGWTFASKAEARRYGQLLIRGRLGEIRNLELQPRFLLPYNGGAYVADFRYEERVDYFNQETRDFGTFWRDTVEDVKGVRTAVYRLKRRLVEAFHGIQIREVQG